MFKESNNETTVQNPFSVWITLFGALLLSGTSLGTLIAQQQPNYLSDQLKPKFKTFKKKPKHRAFALGRNGAYGTAHGHSSKQEARSNALSRCRKYADECTVIAVNERLVVRENPFSSDGESESESDGSLLYILFLVVISVGSGYFFFWYKARQGSNPNLDPIRERSLRVSADSEQVVQKAQEFARNTTGYRVHETRSETVILESTPGIVSDGHFFWIETESRSPNDTLVSIECRPRIFKLWHPFATREIESVQDGLRNVYSK